MIDIYMDEKDFGSWDNPNDAYWWVRGLRLDPVWYDGEKVYKNSQVKTWEEAGYSGDGMRRTGNRYNTENVVGAEIPLADVPAEVMAYIRQQWDNHLAELEAARVREEKKAAERAAYITIAGESHSRNYWSTGVKIWRQELSPDDFKTIADNGFVLENIEGSLTAWVYDPNAERYYPE